MHEPRDYADLDALWHGFCHAAQDTADGYAYRIADELECWEADPGTAAFASRMLATATGVFCTSLDIARATPPPPPTESWFDAFDGLYVPENYEVYEPTYMYDGMPANSPRPVRRPSPSHQEC